MKGKGKLLILEGVPGQQTSDDRVKGIKDYVGKNFPGIRYKSISAHWQFDEGRKITEDTLQSWPDLGGIVGVGGNMVGGCGGSYCRRRTAGQSRDRQLRRECSHGGGAQGRRAGFHDLAGRLRTGLLVGGGLREGAEWQAGAAQDSYARSMLLFRPKSTSMTSRRRS